MPRHTASFKFHDHTVRVDYDVVNDKIVGYYTCHTASVSEVGTKAMAFMLENRVTSMIVDGAPITRLY
jgi:hypothetical protein